MALKYVSWFSAGVTSTVATKIAINEYGKNNIDIYYFDTGSAHQDNKRFIKQCEQWFELPIKQIQSRKFKNHFDVIEKTRYINGAAGARCTGELKKEMRYYVMENETFDHHIMGYEFAPKEINRAIRFKQQYPDTNPVFPLIDKKLTKQDCAAMLTMAKIDLPIMYLQSFQNNNCIGCPKGGIGYWLHIKKFYPDVFDRMAKIERDIGATCITSKIYKKIDGKKVCIGRKKEWLDELEPGRGIGLKPIVPSCGAVCEVEFENITDKRVKKILNGQLKMDFIK